jgi:hypothetical protein
MRQFRYAAADVIDAMVAGITDLNATLEILNPKSSILDPKP